MNRDRRYLWAALVCFIAAMILIWLQLSYNAVAPFPPSVPTLVPTTTMIPASGGSGNLYQRTPSATYHFDAGLNFIALAVEPTITLTARGLLEAIDGQGGNTIWVDRWIDGGWETHVKGKSVNDFTIEIGRGYVVFADRGSDFVLRGRVIHGLMPVPITVGWNLVGVPAIHGTNAEQVLKRLRGRCPEIRRWNGTDWDVHMLGGKHPFRVDPREGYFIRCEQHVEP